MGEEVPILFSWARGFSGSYMTKNKHLSCNTSIPKKKGVEDAWLISALYLNSHLQGLLPSV